MTEDAAWMRPDGDLGAYVASPEPPPPPRRKRGATIAIAAGAAVAVVAGVLAVATINSNGGGGTPEAAVQKLFDALDHEDALGALDALLPAERDVVGNRLTRITSELGRLGILSDHVDLSHIPGGDISFEGLKYQSQALADDVAVVSVTGDKLSLAITAKDLPLGGLTRPLAAQGITSPDPAAPIAVRMVAVRQGGDWYVSLGHSVAEDIRKDSDFGEPDFAKAVQPRGESSPEAAVREMARAAADLDVRRLVELAPPGEGAALHDYAPLFLDGVEQYAKAAKAGGPLFTIDALDLTTKESGDEARVVVDKLEVTENTAGARSSFGTDGRCLHYQDAGQSEPTQLCPDDPELVGEFGRTSFQPLAITTVKEGGSWYVSPVRTELDSLLEMLKATTSDELEKAVADSGPSALYSILNPVPFEFVLLFERAAIGSSSEEEASGSCVVASPQGRGTCGQAVTPPATVVETVPPLPLPITTTVP